jgi:hypothetical protein
MRSPSRQQFLLLIIILAVFARPNHGVTLTAAMTTATTATAVAFLPLHQRHHHHRDKCTGISKQLRLSPSLQSTGKAGEGSEEKKDGQRRKVLLGGAGIASAAAFLSPPIFSSSSSSRIKSAFAATLNDNEPIADLPMRRLHLPKGGMGREYVIIQVYIQGKGPYDFMVDSGLTTELITPREFCLIV